PYDPEVPPGPGIIFFHEPSEALFDLVRRASRNGRERVLALAASGAPVAAAVAWQLLECGASDTFAWHGEAAAQIASRFGRWAEIDRLIAEPVITNNLIGTSPAWISLLRRVVEVARFT